MDETRKDTDTRKNAEPATTGQNAPASSNPPTEAPATSGDRTVNETPGPNASVPTGEPVAAD